MLEKILLAYDGSKHSQKALNYVVALAKIENSEVNVLTVHEKIYHSSRIVYDTATLEKSLHADAEEQISQATKVLKEAGINFTAKIMEGEPAEVICDEAEKNNVDFIVMGSRGLNPSASFLLGSVAVKVLNHSHCPVFIVK